MGPLASLIPGVRKGADFTLRVRVDPTRCTGHGVCADIAPAVFKLDRYGYAYVAPEAGELIDSEAAVRVSVREAEAKCPARAILVERVARAGRKDTPDSTRGARERGGLGVIHRLMWTGEQPESLEDRRAAGGFSPLELPALLDELRAARLAGEGGAGFPAGSKWQALNGARSPVVVINGAEREPGTLKDRYLMTVRPHLVLDGAWAAVRALDSGTLVLAVDASSGDASAGLTTALAEEQAAGLWAGVQVSVVEVPSRYVVGEETALLGFLNGQRAVPRLRPPYPTQSGFSERPTLVHNVTTIAQVALLAAHGADWFSEAGTAEEPGTGLFSVGMFAGECRVVERPLGYPLRGLLDEERLLDDAVAAIVGGWSGGVLPRAAFDVALSQAGLAPFGVPLGTRSIQVLDEGMCVIGVAARILRFFADETAHQCPPCHQGLPDVATTFDRLERGLTTEAEVAETERFVATLFGRGACRLPDGAARLVTSILEHFPEAMEDHLAGRVAHPKGEEHDG